jgi:hypothetical protein
VTLRTAGDVGTLGPRLVADAVAPAVRSVT